MARTVAYPNANLNFEEMVYTQSKRHISERKWCLGFEIVSPYIFTSLFSANERKRKKQEHLLFEALTQFMKRSALQALNEIVG